jgi:acyl CoA:acetate/3-ketoacid CoA transferase alpha subunit
VADKVKSIAEAVESVPDGAHIALGGFAIARNPIAFVHELIRKQKKNLTISQAVMGMDTDLLVGAGLVKKLIVGGGSLDRFGSVHCVNRARETGSVISINSSSLSITFGYLAGALGISFIPIKSMMESEMLEVLEKQEPDYLKMGACPFTGEKYVMLRALTPDIALIHVPIADRKGNCWINGPQWENEEAAKAARRVIVVTEELVPTEFIQRSPERTIIPGHRVDMVVHQAHGAHPTSVFGSYDFDAKHLQLYVKHSRTPETMKEYLDKYVFGTKDFWEYLDMVGGAKMLDDIKAEAIWGY